MVSDSENDLKKMISAKDKMKYSRLFKKAQEALKQCLSIPCYENREITITTKVSKTAKFQGARPPQVIIKGANFENQAPQSEPVRTGNDFHSEILSVSVSYFFYNYK